MITESVNTNPEASMLLREAAEWRLIGLLFECPDGQWLQEVAALASEVDDAELKTAAGAARGQATAGRYHSAFGPGGPAAPREVSYRDTILPGHLISELQAFYNVFGYAPPGDEPPDHVCVQANFVGYLRLKQAYAVLRNDVDQAEVTAEAVRQFCENHLSAMAEPLANALAWSDLSYLASTAAALLRRVGPRPQAGDEQGLPVLEHADGTLECG